MTTPRWHYEASPEPDYPEEWRVEAVGSDGEIYLTRFSGPDSKARAIQYAYWKNGGA